MNTAAVLVCEGPCNAGDTRRFDAAAKLAGRVEVGAARRDYTGLKSVSLLSDDWLQRARRFVNTVHAFVREERVKSECANPDKQHVYRCVECGTERIYGRYTPAA